VRSAVGLPSIEEQIELALETRRRRSDSSQLGMLEIYQRQAAAAAREQDHSARLSQAADHTQARVEAAAAAAPVLQSSAAARFKALKKRKA
jgi:Mg-chelatase subunit ChlI